ncbi:putative Nicotinamide N-methyltransferase [Neofusicoccum parvum]|uniref:Nicotinamide N-methyltransferase n=1 Tax=Neofusicoccum parvum TaxID=310453 RepID=A0ACB5RR41_9PEZI|nr:putative Nicotinamide N-methyltransferase [Neofusicoccum parvum]
MLAEKATWTSQCPQWEAEEEPSHLKSRKPSRASISPTPVDSGYVSRNEDDDDADEDAEEAAAALRADEFERSFAVRWLTAFIARAGSELVRVGSEEAAQRLVDDAASILASFSETTDPDSDDEDAGLTREFEFAVRDTAAAAVSVRLNDAPLKGTDHTAVGLQSWGAAIVLSGLICADPERFGLPTPSGGTIVELGAGTGLVCLTVAALLQQHFRHRPSTVVATDFHPAVLANLRRNVAANASPVLARPLDWSAPVLEPPLAPRRAAVLLAADVVYAPEHARWLRDCAAALLAPAGVFWLIATVRNAGRGGKFEGIVDTVEAAFGDSDACPTAGDGKVLAILGVEWVEKRRGVGRGDESGYKLYRIGWS